MRFLIAEPDELEIKGLHWLITANQIPHDELIETRSPSEFELAVRNHEFDLIIINIDLFTEEEWRKAKNSLKYSRGEIIVHSAHQTFYIANEALEIGAKHLFIQPISPNEWSAKVRKLVRQIGFSTTKSKQKNVLSKDTNMYYWLFDYDVEIKDLLDQGNSDESLFVSVLEVDSISSHNYGRDRVLKILQEELQEYSPLIIPTEDWIVLIFNVTHVHKEANLNDFERIFIRLLRYLKDQYNISVTVGLGNEYSDINKLRDSYTEAKTSIHRKFYFGVNQVYRYDQPFDLHGIDPILTPNEREQLINFLNKKDKQGIKEFLFNLFLVKYNQLDQFPHPDYIRIKLTSVMANIRRHMLKNTELKNLEKQYQSMFNEILNGEELSVIVQKLVYFCYAIFNSGDYLQSFSYSQVTRRVVDYITNNYDEAITLDTLANSVGKNKYYLSHLFKRETEQTISEFIQKVRIDQAKRLLETTSKTIQEIGFQVGYEDQSYFSRIFKKLEKLTPNEYKSNIVKKEQ